MRTLIRENPQVRHTKPEDERVEPQYQLVDYIEAFYKKAAIDPRIGTSHISLYLIILTRWYRTAKPDPLLAFNWQIMHAAKIQSTSTYTRLIKDLLDSKYIAVSPSYYKKIPSSYRLLLMGK